MKEKLLKYLYFITHMNIMAIIILVGTYLSCYDNEEISTGFFTSYRVINVEQYIIFGFLTIALFMAYWNVYTKKYFIEIFKINWINRILSILLIILYMVLFVLGCFISMSYAEVGLFSAIVNVPNWIQMLLLFIYGVYPIGDIILCKIISRFIKPKKQE